MCGAPPHLFTDEPLELLARHVHGRVARNSPAIDKVEKGRNEAFVRAKVIEIR